MILNYILVGWPWFLERLSEKVHETILKGIDGGSKFTVL